MNTSRWAFKIKERNSSSIFILKHLKKIDNFPRIACHSLPELLQMGP